jgi:hypothetical protein
LPAQRVDDTCLTDRARRRGAGHRQRLLFLCTEAANYMTGQELVIDGRDNGRWSAQGSVLTRRRAKVPRFRSSAEVTPREMTAFFCGMLRANARCRTQQNCHPERKRGTFARRLNEAMGANASYTFCTGPGYRRTSASAVRRMMPSTRDWARSIRSKGSLYSGGRSSRARAETLLYDDLPEAGGAEDGIIVRIVQQRARFPGKLLGPSATQSSTWVSSRNFTTSRRTGGRSPRRSFGRNRPAP